MPSNSTPAKLPIMKFRLLSFPVTERRSRSFRRRPRARGDPVSFCRKTLDSRSDTKMSGNGGGLRASSRGCAIVSEARRSVTRVLHVLDLVELDVPRLAVDHLHFAQVNGL